MSATSYFNADVLNYHGVHLRAGVKKEVKQGLARTQRRRTKAALAGEVSSLQAVELQQSQLLTYHEAAQAWLTEHAHLLLNDVYRTADRADDFDEEPELSQDGESLEIPLHLQGSLPDWMLNELEAANGNAFNVLSLFEAKRPSPKAAFGTSMDDEALYA